MYFKFETEEQRNCVRLSIINDFVRFLSSGDYETSATTQTKRLLNRFRLWPLDIEELELKVCRTALNREDNFLSITSRNINCPALTNDVAQDMYHVLIDFGEVMFVDYLSGRFNVFFKNGRHSFQ